MFEILLPGHIQCTSYISGSSQLSIYRCVFVKSRADRRRDKHDRDRNVIT